MGKWGKTRVRGNVDEFFKSTTWAEIIKRLEGTDPIVFIIMKKTGEVHNIVIKGGFQVQGLTPDDIEGIHESHIEPKIKENVDKIFKSDLIARHPRPKIIGLEEHAPVKAHKEPSLDPIESPPMPTSTPADAIEVPPAVPAEPVGGGEVDLKEGMKIIFLDESGAEKEGQIVSLFEEEGQLLIAQPGTRKKDIIDADKIRRLA